MNDTIEAKWCSFMPALMRAMVSSSGPVLEIGIGHFSTPVLHEVCLAQNRMLMSVEDNPDWYLKFCSGYADKNHAMYLIDYDDWLPTLAQKQQFGVVFIDESPGGARRRKSFELFMPVSQFVVVHDYHRENSEAIQPLLTDLSWKVYSDYEPPTLLAWKA